MKKTTRIMLILASVLLVFSMTFSLTGCKGNNSHSLQTPTDNDIEGWFSVEIVNQYNVAAFILPEGTEVVSKPEPDKLYLTGDENAFRTTVAYAYESIKSANKDIYTPVFGIGEDSVATVTGLTPITHIDYDKLYPTGEDMVVTIVYKVGHKAYECTVSYENNNQVYIAFANKTDLYLPLM